MMMQFTFTLNHQLGNPMKEKQLQNALYLIEKNNPNTIKAYVAKEALARKSIHAFFIDLKRFGCVSGMVISLNHYDKTHQFFETYYEEIEQLRQENQRVSDVTIHDLQYDLKTALAWFAFEQTAEQLIHELQIRLPQL
jgi:hypothetical protein